MSDHITRCPFCGAADIAIVTVMQYDRGSFSPTSRYRGLEDHDEYRDAPAVVTLNRGMLNERLETTVATLTVKCRGSGAVVEYP